MAEEPVDRHYDVIVVGAGYGGTTLAALQAHAGRRVLLVDKNPRAGGKGMTIDRHGCRYEMWGGVGVPAHNSRFEELIKTIGADDRIEFLFPDQDDAESHYKNAAGEWRRSIDAPDADQGSRMRFMYGAADEDFETLAGVFAAIVSLSEDELDALDDTGMLDWVRGFGVREPFVSQLMCSLNLLFAAPVNRVPVSEAARTLRDLYTDGAGRYCVGGYGRVAEVCADYVVECGGDFLPSTRVERIAVEGGRAVGVETKRGLFRAPVVVSNAGIQPTVLKLAGAEHFPADYVEWVQGLEPSWGIVGVRYVLDAPVFRTPLNMVYSDQSWWDDERYAAAAAGNWPDVSLVFVGVPNLVDPSLVPTEEQQVAISASLGPADPRSPMNDEALAEAERTIHEVWPEVTGHILHREPYHALHVSNMTRDAVVPGQGGEAIGLAQVIGQCGRAKPSPRTPLPGLFLVGCDAGGYGAGTHQAADSGFRVAEMLDADFADGGPGHGGDG